jgi:hypothetical protein
MQSFCSLDDAAVKLIPQRQEKKKMMYIISNPALGEEGD